MSERVNCQWAFCPHSAIKDSQYCRRHQETIRPLLGAERSEVVSAPEPKPLSLAGDRCPICASPQKDIKNGVAYEFNPGECPSPWRVPLLRFRNRR